jgi:hypothetical protein
MTAAELLADLEGQGFTLTPVGRGIEVSPISQLSPAQRQAILAHKRELLQLLRPPLPPWDQAEAERLLAELRQAVDQARRDHGRPFSPSLARVVADGLAISKGFIDRHELERRRNWDSLQLLRGMRSHLSDLIARARQQRTA